MNNQERLERMIELMSGPNYDRFYLKHSIRCPYCDQVVTEGLDIPDLGCEICEGNYDILDSFVDHIIEVANHDWAVNSPETLKKMLGMLRIGSLHIQIYKTLREVNEGRRQNELPEI